MSGSGTGESCRWFREIGQTFIFRPKLRCAVHKSGYYYGMHHSAHHLGIPSLQIGSVTLDGRAILAPMSGVTDVVMRRIARRFGASLVVSEMVASDD